MKEQIEVALHILIGLPLWDARRASTLESFHFGTPHEVLDRMGTSLVGTYALNVQCAWRINGPTDIIVGSSDRYLPAGGDPYQHDEDFDWDEKGANRLDERIEAFFQARRSKPLIVDSISADNLGGVQMYLTEGYVLCIFPDSSFPGEHWRLLRPGVKEEHFVITGSGIET